jgi:hypothetical protein
MWDAVERTIIPETLAYQRPGLLPKGLGGVMRYPAWMARGFYQRTGLQQLGPNQKAVIERLTNAEHEWVPRDEFPDSYQTIGSLKRRGLVQEHCVRDDEGEIQRRFLRYVEPGTEPTSFNAWLGRRIVATYPKQYRDKLDPEVLAMLERHLDDVGQTPWLCALYYANQQDECPREP